MTCEQCKYHIYIDGTHYCDSKNHKRRIVRIGKEDAEKDIDCLWADKAESEESEENESRRNGIAK